MDMRKTAQRTLAAAIFLLALTFIFPYKSLAQVDACPGLSDLLKSEQFKDAEKIARACLEQNPGNVPVQVALSKALAGQKQYVEAIKLAEDALNKYPKDTDLQAWLVRVLAWSGNYDKAWNLAEKLPKTALLDKDNARLVADLAFWKKDYKEAISRYDRFLEKWPTDHGAIRNRGTCYWKSGNDDRAKEDFETLCNMSRTNSDASCDPLKELKEHLARYTLFIQPEYWTRTKEFTNLNIQEDYEGWDGFLLFDVRAWNTLHVGASIDHRTRDYGEGQLDDQYLEGYASYLWDSGFYLYGAVGGTIDTDFSPIYTAAIEPGFIFKFGLELYLRYWRIEFEESGVHVISPALVYTLGPARFYFRYYHGIDDDPDIAQSNAYLGKLTFYIKSISLSGGGGYGDRTDYLEIDQMERDEYWLVTGGIGWQIHWRHGLMFDYVYRNEIAESLALEVHYTQHQYLLGYKLRF